MVLRSLSQLNVRNLRTPQLALTPGVVALVGRNASGKSNVMDAAYLGCTGELPAGTIAETVRIGESEGFVAADVEHSGGVSRIEVGLAPGRKQLRLDGQAVRVADIARTSTAVLITPEDADLVHGSPAKRRAYLDALLSKLSARYSALTREYQRVLEQRNALLRTGAGDAGLEVWTARFVALGSEIDDLRRRAVLRVCELAAATYAEVAGDGKALSVRLQQQRDACDLGEALALARAEERARGVTPVGPHRDDLALDLDAHSAQAYGSRGEARTVALALRVAEYRLLEEKHAEPPVLLVDDFTAELDSGRRAFLLDLTSRTPQALVSGTEPPPRADLTLHVEDGVVLRA
ncbi:MAG TPA: DNA replication and repair protein RecF [Trueperaceae bacterium]|nr:DNA replication and repair protein RecF [Trueperaceae bacterium]